MTADSQSSKELNTALSEKECREYRTIFRHTPEVLQIELTDRCNAGCIMCSHYYKKNIGAGDLRDGVLEKIEPLLENCRLMLLNGYGEPFISGKYRQCMDLLKRYDVKAFVTTNLSVFTEEMKSDARDVFEQVCVSCHGCTRSDYEKISRGLSFDRFTDNLKRLMSIQNGPAVSLSVVAMAANIGKAEDFIHFARQYGIREVRFGRLGINSYIDNTEQDLIHYRHAASQFFEDARKTAEQCGIRIVYPDNYKDVPVQREILEQEIEALQNLVFAYTNDHQRRLTRQFQTEHSAHQYRKEKIRPFSTEIRSSGICDWVGRGLYIDKNGDCYPCCETSEITYGNVLTDSLDSILNGENAVCIRRSFYEGKLPYFCLNCPFIANQELKMLKVEKKDEVYRAIDYSTKDHSAESEEI